MDNRIFNVNGKGSELLKNTLALAFAQNGTHTKAKGWLFNKKKGLILIWVDCEGASKFMAPLSALDVAPMVEQWLASEEAASMEFESWDADQDHDGSNSMGWRVYCEDWGHVADRYQAICAIRPAYMWHGK